MTMKTASIAEMKKSLSAYIDLAEAGEEIEVRRRNVPVARLVGVTRGGPNRTRIGFARGTVKFRGALTGPLVPPRDWAMHGRDPA